MNAITIAVCHPPPYTQGTTHRPIPFSFEFFNQIQCKTERHHWASPGVFRLFPFRHCFTLPLPLHDIRTSLTFPPYLPTRSSFPYFAFSAHTARIPPFLSRSVHPSVHPSLHHITSFVRHSHFRHLNSNCLRPLQLRRPTTWWPVLRPLTSVLTEVRTGKCPGSSRRDQLSNRRQFTLLYFKGLI